MTLVKQSVLFTVLHSTSQYRNRQPDQASWHMAYSSRLVAHRYLRVPGKVYRL